jgi:5-methylcytosine-specific restriction endonuclease McrA
VTPIKPCLVHRCTGYAPKGRSRCPTHEAEFEAARRANPDLTGRRGTSPEWRRARGLSLWRHKHTCQKCGVTQAVLKSRRESLEVHHVDGDASNNRQSNLLPLCPSCHRDLTYGPNSGILSV